MVLSDRRLLIRLVLRNRHCRTFERRSPYMFFGFALQKNPGVTYVPLLVCIIYLSIIFIFGIIVSSTVLTLGRSFLCFIVWLFHHMIVCFQKINSRTNDR